MGKARLVLTSANLQTLGAESGRSGRKLVEKQAKATFETWSAANTSWGSQGPNACMHAKTALTLSSCQGNRVAIAFGQVAIVNGGNLPPHDYEHIAHD